MRKLTLLIILIASICPSAFSQGIYISNSSGAWTTPANWTLIGSDSDGILYPDANDQVIINSHTMTISGTTEQSGPLSLSSGVVEFSGTSARLDVRGSLSSSGSSSVEGTSNNHRLVIINNGVSVFGNISVTAGTFTIDGVRLTNNGPSVISAGATLTIDDATSPTVISNHLFSGITVETGGTFQNNDAVTILAWGDISNNGTFNGCPDNTCLFNFSDGNSHAVSGTSVTNMPRVLIYNGSTLTNQGVISAEDILGNATGTNTFVNEDSLVLNTAGIVDVAELTLDFDAVGNDLTFVGSTNEQLFAATFHNVNINLDDGFVINLNNGVSATINNNLVVSSGQARIIPSANTLSVLGNVEIENNGSFLMNNTNVGEGINITGDFNVSTTNASGVDLNNGTISFAGMNVTNGAEVSLGISDLTSSGTITVTNGTVNADANSTPTFTNIVVEANGSWVSSSVYDPIIQGDITNNGVFTACLNTTGCEYSLESTNGSISGNSQITNLSFIDLNDGASYTNTNSGGLLIGSGIRTTSGTGSFINGANGLLNYSGTIGNFSVTNFTASATGNTVIYSRADINQLVRTTTDANNEYYNLEIDKADGIDAVLEGSTTIANQLTLNAGDLQLNAFDLTLADGATITGGGETGYIKMNTTGTVIQEYSSAGATLSFPIGDIDDYSPINSLTIHSATFSAPASLSFTITDGVNTNRDNDNQVAGGDDDGAIPSEVYLSRFWTLTPTNISDATFSATYTYLDADVVDNSATLDETAMVGTVYRTPIGETFLDWSVEQAVDAVNNIVTVSNVETEAFGVLYAMDNNMLRLPVELISFEIFGRNGKVELNWATASEENNSHFDIERSVDGETFEVIGTESGKGNSDRLNEYSFIDDFPIGGRTFYRLKQVDYSGDFDYTPVRSVKLESKVGTVKLYPNPATGDDKVLLEIPANTFSEIPQIRVLNKLYQTISLPIEKVDSNFLLDTSNIKRGPYLVVIKTSDQVMTKRLIVN